MIHWVVGIDCSLPKQLLRLSSVSSVLYKEDIGGGASKLYRSQSVLVRTGTQQQVLHSLAVVLEYGRSVRVGPGLPHIGRQLLSNDHTRSSQIQEFACRCLYIGRESLYNLRHVTV